MPAYGFYFNQFENNVLLKTLDDNSFPEIDILFKEANPDNTYSFENDEIEICFLKPSKLFLQLKAEISLERIIHPNLQPVISTLCNSYDYSAFHAGAIIYSDNVWGILGDRGAGKSTLLKLLNQVEHLDIFTDDILAFDKTGFVFNGPRSIGLRADSNNFIYCKNEVAYYQLPPVKSKAKFKGWIVLGWSNSFGASQIYEKSLDFELKRHILTLQTNIQDYLCYEAWKIRRPLDWKYTKPTVELILNCIKYENN